MPDRDRLSFEKPDKRKKKLRGQQHVNIQTNFSNDRSLNSQIFEAVASCTASSRRAGNQPESEPISQFPTTPTPTTLPDPPSRKGTQSESGSAFRQTHMRKKSSPVKKDKKKEKDNRDSHPLNLPPDELRRLSAAMAAQEGARNSMDVDSNGPVSSHDTESPATPHRTPLPPFPDNANGTVNGINGDHEDDKSPTPPPHRVPMVEKPTVDAEAAKAAGNKFFKAKDYSRAIAEYTKGW